jgi:ABC-type transporter Mla MlaB component
MVVGDASAVGRCDIGTVDLVTRLALTARRGGSRLIVRDAPAELRELLALAGLEDVVACAEDSALEPER